MESGRLTLQRFKPPKGNVLCEVHVSSSWGTPWDWAAITQAESRNLFGLTSQRTAWGLAEWLKVEGKISIKNESQVQGLFSLQHQEKKERINIYLPSYPWLVLKLQKRL